MGPTMLLNLTSISWPQESISQPAPLSKRGIQRTLSSRAHLSLPKLTLPRQALLIHLYPMLRLAKHQRQSRRYPVASNLPRVWQLSRLGWRLCKPSVLGPSKAQQDKMTSRPSHRKNLHHQNLQQEQRRTKRRMRSPRQRRPPEPYLPCPLGCPFRLSERARKSLFPNHLLLYLHLLRQQHLHPLAHLAHLAHLPYLHRHIFHLNRAQTRSRLRRPQAPSQHQTLFSQ